MAIPCETCPSKIECEAALARLAVVRGEIDLTHVVMDDLRSSLTESTPEEQTQDSPTVQERLGWVVHRLTAIDEILLEDEVFVDRMSCSGSSVGCFKPGLLLEAAQYAQTGIDGLKRSLSSGEVA